MLLDSYPWIASPFADCDCDVLEYTIIGVSESER
jgi:hypothetical protein